MTDPKRCPSVDPERGTRCDLPAEHPGSHASGIFFHDTPAGADPERIKAGEADVEARRTTPAEDTFNRLRSKYPAASGGDDTPASEPPCPGPAEGAGPDIWEASERTALDDIREGKEQLARGESVYLGSFSESPLDEASRRVGDLALKAMRDNPDHDTFCLLCEQSFKKELGHACSVEPTPSEDIAWPRVAELMDRIAQLKAESDARVAEAVMAETRRCASHDNRFFWDMVECRKEAVAEAVRDEREACAEVAEHLPISDGEWRGDVLWTPISNARYWFAAAIRARSDKK